MQLRQNRRIGAIETEEENRHAIETEEENRHAE